MHKRKSEKRGVISPESLLTSYQAGTLLQVNPSSVNKWVKEGRIQAFRTPGGHHRIRASDLVEFLQAHKMPVPRRLQAAMRRRIMFVDDDTKQLKVLERLLKPYGRQVELRTLDNGIEALVQVGSFQPDLVIIDVYMPGLDGIEVCKRLHQMKETEGVRVVITSGQLSREIERDAKAAGAFMTMEKPIDTDSLLEVLDLDPVAEMSA